MHSSFFVTTTTLAQVTDTTNIGLVFAAVKETILGNALKDSEILSAAQLMGRILCCLVSSFHISFEHLVSDVRSLLSLHRSSFKKIPTCHKSIEIVVRLGWVLAFDFYMLFYPWHFHLEWCAILRIELNAHRAEILTSQSTFLEKKRIDNQVGDDIHVKSNYFILIPFDTHKLRRTGKVVLYRDLQFGLVSPQRALEVGAVADLIVVLQTIELRTAQQPLPQRKSTYFRRRT
jgi:hypothetical protein